MRATLLLITCGLLALGSTGCAPFPIRTPQPAPMGPIGGGDLTAGAAEGYVGGAGGFGCDRLTGGARELCSSLLGDAAFTGGIELGVGEGVSVVAVQATVRASNRPGPLAADFRSGVRFRHTRTGTPDAPRARGTVVGGVGGHFGLGGLLEAEPTFGLDGELGWADTRGSARPRVGVRVAVVVPVEPLWGGWSSGPWLYLLPEAGIWLTPPGKTSALDIGISAWLGVRLVNRDWVAAGLEINGHWLFRAGQAGATSREDP